MNLAEAITEVRLRLDDKAPPYLWATPDLTRYINEAQDEAAYRARLLYDDTTPQVVEIPLRAGVATYPLHSKVFRIDRAVLLSDGEMLERTTKAELDEEEPRWERRTGMPCAYIESEGAIRFHPTPIATDTIRLSVWRYPLCPLCTDKDEPEIARIEHMNMLDWAFHLAYLKRDSDVEDRSKAEEYEAKFVRRFGPRETADVYRKRRLRRAIVCRPEW